MKKLILLFSLGLVAASVPAFAGNEMCTGTTSPPTEFMTGNCLNGLCSATVPSAFIQADGTCPSGASFSANGFLQTVFFNGSCGGGLLNGTIDETNLTFSGSCSNGGSFTGSAYTSPVFVNGTCTPNGFFSATVTYDAFALSGNCVSPN